jgi:hypothetical protein
MTNEIELNDEQLAEVTGGGFSITNIAQVARSFTAQNNVVNANTAVFALGGGRHSSVTAAAQGSTNNVGNTSISLNENSF